ncbi:hypothetical protein Tco_0033729 [Tanacetum coccineum]
MEVDTGSVCVEVESVDKSMGYVGDGVEGGEIGVSGDEVVGVFDVAGVIVKDVACLCVWITNEAYGIALASNLSFRCWWAKVRRESVNEIDNCENAMSPKVNWKVSLES